MGNDAAGAPQSNTRRSTTGGDSRQQAPPGLGGLGLPGLEGMLGGNGMPDPAVLTQLMQNPAISQMMQSMLSNPQTLSQVSLFTVPCKSTRCNVHVDLVVLILIYFLDS